MVVTGLNASNSFRREFNISFAHLSIASLTPKHSVQEPPLISYLIEGFLDLVEVIEVVLHSYTDGVHSMRTCQPLPCQQLIEVVLIKER